MRKLFCATLMLTCLATFAQRANLVNPFVGTDGHGHTYPGVCAPFGMVQLSPDTRLNGWDGCSGYHYSDSIIYGFSHTHLSGTGCEDLCDILFTPTILKNKEENYNLKFSHKDETAFAGYYSVKAWNNDYITIELASTERKGYHRYHFPKERNMAIVINMKHRDKTLGWSIDVRNDSMVCGYRKSESWAVGQEIYFASKFSKKIKSSYLDKNFGTLYLDFGENDGDSILEAVVAISSVDNNGAVKNLMSNDGANDFLSAKNRSISLWENALGKIEVKGGTLEERKTFYTNLYHSMLAPSLYSDVDGRYRSMINTTLANGAKQNPIATAIGYNRYTTFSNWDTYRTLSSLLTIIAPDKIKDFGHTYLDYYEQTGELPMWELWSYETYCMIGLHGVSTLAEWVMKDMVADNELALKAMISTANMDKLGLNFFNHDRYISSEKEHESVSKTVEFAYNMYCIAMVAKKLGKTDIYNEYIQRAQYYKNLFNPNNGFIQPKENGRFIPNFDARQVDINYTEGNGWHYTFYVPQDIETLVDMMGGVASFEAKLDECFTSKGTTGREQADVTGLIGQYAHGNEPSQHTAYLYNYIGKGYKTQELTYRILTTLYSSKPDGICGNDDCGQMGAWYVMSSMGFYPVCPVSGEYILTTPLFDTIVIHLNSGKDFTITKNKTTDGIYIQSIRYNNTPYYKNYITHKMIDGGNLEITTSKNPTDFAVRKSDLPSSLIDDMLITPEPYIEYEGTGTFTDKLIVTKTYLTKSFDVSRTDREIIDTTDTLRVGQRDCYFYKIPGGRTIKLLTSYSPQYTGGGENALIDQKQGSNNWRLGCWQGYWGDDLEAIIDLGKEQKVSKVGGNFIQETKAWIFMPTRVEYYISSNGKDFKPLQTIPNPIDEHKDGISTHTFFTSKPFKARYIKIKAINRKTNPSWHLSPGEKSWIFADEVIIKN